MTHSNLKSFYDYEIALIEHDFLSEVSGLPVETYKAYTDGIHDFAQRLIEEIRKEED